jgi:hypothetical protein
MTTNTTSPVKQAGGWGSRRNALGIAAVFLVLAAAAGTGIWIIVDSMGTSTPPAVRQSDRAPAAGAARAAQGTGNATSGTAARSSGATVPGRTDTIILVDSQEQANTVTGAMAQAEAAPQGGASPLTGTVVVVDSPETENRLTNLLGAADAVNLGAGLPPLRVVDLRHR